MHLAQLLFFLVLLTMASNCSSALGGPPRRAASERTIAFDETANATQVSGSVGDVLEVSLGGNPTTGFGWSRPTAASSEGALDALKASDGSDFEYSTPHYPVGFTGGGGTFVFRWLCSRRGNDTIALVYSRSWETGTAPARTFSLFVSVK
jgi:predicted secreted protein